MTSVAPLQPPTAHRSRAWLGLAILLALTTWAFRHNVDLGFTGADALADVAAARVETPGDLLHQVWMPLTDGIAGINANFWRPITSLHYALLHGLFGWNAAAWQAWDLGLHLLVVTLVFVLVRSVRRSDGEALLAAGLLALHPLSIELAPAVARNLDVLFTLFGVATLIAVARKRVGLAVLLGALAIGSKEAAVVVLPVAVVWTAAISGRRRAIVLGAAYGVVLPLYLLGRSAVLRGWGGYNRTGPTFFTGQTRRSLSASTLEVLFPGWTPNIEAWIPHSLGFALTMVLLAAGCFGAWRAWRRGNQLPAVGLALAFLPLFLYAITGLYSRRLLYLPVVGIVLAAPALLHGRVARVILLAWIASLLPGSPLLVPDDDWRRSDEVTEGITNAMAGRWAELPQGALVWIMDKPLHIDHDPRRQMLWRDGHSVTNTLAHYSIGAWVDARLGRGDIELRQANRVEFVAALDEPTAVAEGDWIRVRRGPIQRTFGTRAGWEHTQDGDDLLVRRKGASDNEWLLVAGYPRSVLIRLPTW